MKIVAAVCAATLALGLLFVTVRPASSTPRAAVLDSTPLSRPATITATGTGQAAATPDIMIVSLGVQTTAPSASRALSTNNTETGAVIAKLKGDGIADKDLQTAQFSINADYSPPAPNNPTPHLTGYTASDILSVTIRVISSAGKIVDDAVAAAGDDAQVQSISYALSDPGALAAAAHADAVNQAHAAAQATAKAAGVQLGAIESATDVFGSSSPAFYGAAGGSTSAGSGAAAPGIPPVPIQAGSQTDSVQVAVTYAVD